MTSRAPTNVLPFKARKEPDHFAGCPECPYGKAPDNIWNVRETHYAICEKHKTAWRVGSNLFSSWRSQTQEDWDDNAALLASEYRNVTGEAHKDAP